ncbi:MAG: CoA transferase [Pseudomonadota bacterium]
MVQPLAGIRVVEMTVAIQGPAAGLYLAEMGAQVTKVEPPLGDSNRYHKGTDCDLPDDALGSQFVAMNRGKRSLCIDVHHPLGQQALANLVAQADVFLSNYREDALQRMGMDYETLHARHPQLVYATVNGFGPKGPDAEKAMLDGVAQARGGILSMTRQPDDDPLLPGAPIADTTGAMQLALGAMTALFARERHGVGQRVQTSALGAQLWLQMWELQHLAMTGANLAPGGRYHDNMRGPYGIYRTADGGHIMFAACMDNAAWDALWIFAGQPEVALDPDWAMPGQRLGGRGPELDTTHNIRARMCNAFASHTTDEWVEFLYSQPEIIWERVRSHPDVLADPQNLANGYVSPVELPDIGAHDVVGNLVQFSNTPCGPLQPPPLLGEHGPAALREAGLSDAEAEELLGHTAQMREQILLELLGESED